MINYIIYKHLNAASSTQPINWVTFIHGAGGSSSIWYRQIKAFRAHYNVLIVDLRGHGGSKTIIDEHRGKYNFKIVTQDVLDVLDFLEISKSHFVGISLGTIIIRQLADMRPNMVSSMILGGAILKLNLQAQLLMTFGNTFKYICPYILLYQILAFTIMPRKNHRNSRLKFVNEARKMCQKEFIRWFGLTLEVNGLLVTFKETIKIPTYYIMGDEDYMFLPYVKKVAENADKNADEHIKLTIVEKCGHVVNIDQAKIFNNLSLSFLKTLIL
ncbi:alpha/beta hydrolase [Gammaproteobacteria bacterium]|nr:alpha/beta hydrolase [Gammaproteobacteria bacterium]